VGVERSLEHTDDLLVGIPILRDELSEAVVSARDTFDQCMRDVGADTEREDTGVDLVVVDLLVDVAEEPNLAPDL
jgi:hypothetical protein